VTSDANDTAPAVSPDGAFVAFNSDRDGGSDLYLLEIASGSVRRLTTGLEVRSQAGWSGDGNRLVFSGSGLGVDDVFVIGRDGRGLMRLTRGAEGLR
jgi:TolB protein